MDGATSEPCIIFGRSNEIPFAIDFSALSEGESNGNALNVKVGADRYIFLYPNSNFCAYSGSFNYQNKKVEISLSDKLNIVVDGENVLSKQVKDITYSHFQIVGTLCLIYFEGGRKFLVVLDGKKVKFADFYDEVNVDGENLLFLHRLHDSLNHGRVAEIKNKKFESYLVYLDDNELKLRDEFCPMVFLDCAMAGNLKYCNSLLNDSIRQEDEKLIKNFLPEFEDFYPINERKFILLNKNTLAGIYEFETVDCKIENIISQ